MVLSLLIETSAYVVKQIYSLTYYLVYGHQETSEEKLDKLLIQFEHIQKELEMIKIQHSHQQE